MAENGVKGTYTGIRDTNALTKTGTAAAILVLANKGVTNAKTLAPVDTGLLRNSIGYEQDNSGDATVFDNSEYAVYQEYGTRKMPGRGFMRGSMLLVQGESVKTVKAAMDAEWKKGPLKYGVERKTFG